MSTMGHLSMSMPSDQGIKMEPSWTGGNMSPFSHTATSPGQPPLMVGDVSFMPGQAQPQSRSPGRRDCSVQNKSMKCNFCKSCFASTSGLKLHINKVHFNNAKFTCHICQKGFNFKSHFEGHMNVHSGVKGFQCPYCPKRFSYQTGVDIHLRSGKCKSQPQT